MHTYTLTRILLAGLLLGCKATLSAQTLEVVTPSQTKKLTLAALKHKLKIFTVEIDDPVYVKSKKYDAFLLQDVFTLAGMEPSARADELIFTAADGYSPNTTFAKFQTHKAYLAFQEHGSKAGQFTNVAQGKAMVSPAPFYVVWAEGARLKETVPWPYQLVKIELADWAKKFPNVVPQKVAAESAIMKGFRLFKGECIRCHSMNMEGGDIGPELNVPQNITEYWKADLLKPFIKNAASFRFKSKMPDFKRLSDEELDHLIAYLQHMKAFKVANLAH